MSTAERFEQHKGRYDADLQVQHHFSAGVYAKEIHVPAGHTVGQHAHTFDHLSLLARGTVIVHTDEMTQTFQAPACITIKAGIHHEITALTDTVWYCIHATDVTDPDKVDESLTGG